MDRCSLRKKVKTRRTSVAFPQQDFLIGSWFEIGSNTSPQYDKKKVLATFTEKKITKFTHTQYFVNFNNRFIKKIKIKTKKINLVRHSYVLNICWVRPKISKIRIRNTGLQTWKTGTQIFQNSL